MEEKENKKSQNEKIISQKSGNKLLLIVAICLIILIVLGITLNSINNSKVNNNATKTSNTNESSDGTITEKEENSYHIDVSNNSLYTDIQEKKYTNYSRNLEVKYGDDVYFIENNNVYVNHEEEKTIININGETAKYLGEGRDCGGGSVFAITEQGNVYLINNPGTTEIKDRGIILYDKGDAKEIVPIRESKIFTTCGELSLYVLVDNKLYLIRRSSSDEAKIYGTREESHPFSLAYYIYKNSVKWVPGNMDFNFSLLLYPDGSLNNYIYYGWEQEMKNKFITDEDGQNILVNFIYLLEGDVYIVDTKGNVYEMTAPSNLNEEEATEIKIEKLKEFSKNVKSIDLKYVQYTKKEEATSKWLNSESEYSIKLNFDDGTEKTYSTIDGNTVSFDQYYLSNK